MITPKRDNFIHAHPVGAPRTPMRTRFCLRQGVCHFRRSLRLRLSGERGQALPEFALVLPIVLAALFGIIQFALALNSENDQTHLANEVARYAIINENPGEKESLTPQNWAKKQADSSFLQNVDKVCISFPEGAEAGKPIKVEATSTVNWLPVLGLKSVTTTELTGTAYMRLETSPSHYTAGCST